MDNDNGAGGVLSRFSRWLERAVGMGKAGARDSSAAPGAGRTVDRLTAEYQDTEYEAPTIQQERVAVAPKTNPWVYAPIRKIAQSASIVPIQVLRWTQEEGARPQGQPDPGHPAWDILDSPNPYYSWQQLVEASVWQLYQFGRLFYELVRGPDGKVVALFVLRSRYMSVIGDRKSLVGAYQYAPNGTRQTLDPKNVCFIRFCDPDSDLKGLSPLEPARQTINIDADAREHADNAFDNDCTPGLVLQSEKPIPEPEVRRVYRRLQQWNGGPSNARRPLILGGIEAKVLAQSLRDMEFGELRRMNREEFAAVFDVPPIKMGLMEYSSYANAVEQNRHFWLECIQPLVTLICDGLNRAWIWPDYGTREYGVAPDLSQFIGDPEQKARNEGQALALWSGDLITRNEARTRIGLPPIEGDEGGDKYKSQTTPRPAAPLPFAIPGATPGAGGGGIAGDRAPVGAGAEKGGASPGRETPFRKRRCDPDDVVAIVKARDDAALVNEAPIRDVFERIFDRQIKSAVSALRKIIGKADDDEGAKSKRRAEELLRRMRLMLDEAFDASGREIDKAIRDAVGDGAQAASQQIGFELDFNLYDPRVSKYIEAKRLKLAQEINDVTEDKIKREIRAGMEAGEATGAIEDRIRAAFGEDGPGRSRPEIIARTESCAAANYGVLESFKQSGVVEKKQWLATEDDLTRPSHAAASGQVVGVDEDFSVGTSTLSAPGDSSSGAPAEEICNCRCVMLPVFDDGSEGPPPPPPPT